MKNSPWKLFISGDANQYQIIDETGNWIMAIQHNGEHLEEEQLRTLSWITKLPELLETLTTIANLQKTQESIEALLISYHSTITSAQQVLKNEAELYKRRTPTYKELLQTLQDIAKFPLPRETENSPYFIKNSYEEIINLARKIL